MTDSGFSRRQRLTVLLMVAAVIVVFAMLTGLIITSIQGWDSRSPAATLPFVSVVPAPTVLPSPPAADVPE